MAKRQEIPLSKSKRQSSLPPSSPEEQEERMIALAMDRVEQRLLDGTASSQETTHFLKLASSRERLEKEILELQKELIVAKTENLRKDKELEELYINAVNAMKTYKDGDTYE